jgi:tetratricopeptide (TPR) repeat protein
LGLLALTLSGTPPAIGAARPRVVLPFPSPLAGPDRPDLIRSEQRRIDKAWKSLEKGRADAAAKNARKAGTGAVAELLRIQIRMLEGGDSLPALVELTNANPEYAASWLTLSVAAERAGDEPLAFAAAARGAELWSGSSWALRAADLRQRWVVDRVARAGERLAEPDPDQALSEVAPALVLEPDHRDGLMIRASALYELDRLEEADAVLAGLADEPDALLLSGRIAERKGDWLRAMDLYDALPPEIPERANLLRRAQLKWRLSVLPGYVQRSLTSAQLTRAELAVLVVALVPQVEAIGGGRVSVLSDIMDLSSQREIVTVVRLELMEIDRLEPRFFPHRIVSPDEVRAAVERLGELLGFSPPRWCESPHVLSSCQEIAAPVSGERVAEVILNLVHGEG